MTTTAPSAADLETQAHEAEAHARQLEQRVLAGADDVTPEQISEAHSRSGFFRLRAKGKRDREEREARQRVIDAARSLNADAVALAPNAPTRPASKEAKAASRAIATALARYMSAMNAYDEQAADLRRRAAELGVTFGGEDIEGLRDQGSSLVATADDGTVWAVEVSWPASRDRAVVDLLQEAMASLPAKDQVRLW